MEIRTIQAYFEVFFNIRKNERSFVHLFFLNITILGVFYTLGATVS